MSVAPEHKRVGMRGLCATGKLTYDSRREARLGVRRQAATSEVSGLRPYRCPTCGLFHIGHRPGYGQKIPALVECAKRFHANAKCSRPGVHQLETSSGSAWLCDEHWFELQATVKRKRVGVWS